jgi:sialidase-1
MFDHRIVAGIAVGLTLLLCGCHGTQMPTVPSKAAATAPANLPLFESTDLFEAGKDGYTTCRIPAMVITARGTILVACAGRVNGYGDWVDIDTLLRRSTDGGKTWQPMQVVTNDGTNTVDNATLLADGNRVYLMYQINYAHAYLKTSDDEGATWSGPRDITSAFEIYRTRDHFNWVVLAMGPGHGIVLKSGRFVVPIWLASNRSHRPSITSTIYSDDRGQTWHGGDMVTQNLPESKNPSENVCVELADGRVMDNIRCESPANRRLMAYSNDGATHWSKPVINAQLFEPICMASMARYSLESQGSRNRLLFCNPDSEKAGPLKPGSDHFVRKNITVRMSYDEGATWAVSKVIEPGDSGYTDMAVAADGTIFLAYERGSTNSKVFFSPQCISVAKFNLAWLIDGMEPAK